MKVRVTFEVDDIARRAIRWLTKSDGKPATREQVRSFFYNHAWADLQAVVGDWMRDEEAQDKDQARLIKAGVLEPSTCTNRQHNEY